MQSRVPLYLRLVVALAVLAALLVPPLVAPARTVYVPRTMARSVRLAPALTPERLPLRLAATHIAFSWTGDDRTGIAYRLVSSDGQTSSWLRAHEAHDLEHGDHHYSTVLEVDKPLAIRWKAITPPGLRMGPVTVDELNTEDGPATPVTVPATADARARTPDIVTRAEWGANESLKRVSRGCKRHFYPFQQLFVHHTAGVNHDTHPRATMRAIYWFHTERRGWCDIGYNFVIAPNGKIFEGRWARDYKPFELHDGETGSGKKVVQGAHVEGFNSGSMGISMMGNYSTVRPPHAMKHSLARLLAFEADRHNLNPTGSHVYRNPVTGLTKRLPYIAGHRDAGSTECPGNHLYADLPGIRRHVKRIVGAGKANTRLRLSPPTAPAVYGSAARISGRLRSAAGEPLAGRSITIFRRYEGSSWRTEGSVTSRADGRLTATLLLKRDASVIAVYDGGRHLWGSQSHKVVQAVAPKLSLLAEGGTKGPDGVVTYPAGTEAVHLSGTVAPPHVGSTIKVNVSSVDDNGTRTRVATGRPKAGNSGGYRYRFSMPHPGSGGTFRAVAHVAAVRHHAAGRSEPVKFVITPPASG